ncbi:probable leucine-rich repeat receptor-like protein kinase At1g35710 [Durio zibethinus]|uniref:non-specific serine/threonine protein kinase n=1 Tax=Durio zibethinus TaxID=66656 RepID=A0A6P6BIW4_DURZI|nr:probable leucine-rich repeat receptor-like protein kinase At1g35710 [Durio zibethinus]
MLKSLTGFELAQNNFSGSIPASIGNMSKLMKIYLTYNHLSGPIPSTLGNLTHLQSLQLGDNHLSGPLPKNLCKGGQLANLSVINNNLTGPIPPTLKNCKSLYRLQELDLSSNHLVGEIPKELGVLTLMFRLLLSDNQLSGKIPPEIGVLSNLQHLNLASNNLSGPIPNQLGDCSKLLDLNLNLSQNLLIGEIPQQLAKLHSLEILDLSHNVLNGSIPNSFNDLKSLTVVNISYNQLEGPIPNIKAFHEASFDDLRNNKGLCGNAIGLMPCAVAAASNGHRKSTKNRTRKSESIEAQLGEIFTLWGYNGRILYENIIEATEDFSSNNCIGSGGYGTVYKAALPIGEVVAVKKLHQSEDSMTSNNLKAFESEIHALSEIRHRNIVKLYGFCSYPKNSFLVYEFVERGSLREALNNKDEAMDLDWEKRLNVVKAVANALSYMHHDHSPPIIH